MTHEPPPQHVLATASKRQKRYRDKREEEGLTMVRAWVPTKLVNEFKAVAIAMRFDMQGKPPTPKQLYDLAKTLKARSRLYPPTNAIKGDQWRLAVWLMLHGA